MGGGEILRFQWAERAIAAGQPAERIFPNNKNLFSCTLGSHESDDDTSGVLVNYYTGDLDDPIPLPSNCPHHCT